jgi:hypothetical protein
MESFMPGWLAGTTALVAFLLAVDRALKPEAKKEWFWIMFGREPNLVPDLRDLTNRFLRTFETFYQFPNDLEDTTARQRPHRTLWYFVSIGFIVALVCCLVYRLTMRQSGELSQILWMAPVGTFFATIAIEVWLSLPSARSNDTHAAFGAAPAYVQGLGQGDSHTTEVRCNAPNLERLRRLLRSALRARALRFLASVTLIAMALAVLIQCEYSESLSAGSKRLAGLNVQNMGVLKLWIRYLPSHSVTVTLVELGVAFGVLSGIVTGLSIGGPHGAYSGVAAGIYIGFVSALMAHRTILGRQDLAAQDLFWTVCGISVSLPVVLYLTSVVSVRCRRNDDPPHGAILRVLRKFRAVRILMTSVVVTSTLALVAHAARLVTLEEIRTAVFGPDWVFLALNMFADSFSMIETYGILWFASKALAEGGVVSRFGAIGIVGAFVVLFAVDILASGFLFLVFPLISGTDLWEAIVFQGDKRWIGVLFWSSMFTSAMFYLVVCLSVAITLVRPLRNRIRDLQKTRLASLSEENPFAVLAIIVMLLSALGWLVRTVFVVATS